MTGNIKKITTEKEIEVVVYARIGNRDGLAKAKEIIEQEQSQIKTPTGSIRVRRSRQGNSNWLYEMTAKTLVSKGESVDQQEKTTQIDKPTFDVFKGACESTMIKTRFIFDVEKVSIQRPGMQAAIEITGLKYEVDVFQTPDGKMSDWCKIDVEITSLRDQIEKLGLVVDDFVLAIKVSHLPFEPQAYFADNHDKDNTEQRELVDLIYQKQFLTPVQKSV